MECAISDVAEQGASRVVEGGTNVGGGVFRLVTDAWLGPPFDTVQVTVEGALGDVTVQGAATGVKGTEFGDGVFRLVADAWLGPAFEAVQVLEEGALGDVAEQWSSRGVEGSTNFGDVVFCLATDAERDSGFFMPSTKMLTWVYGLLRLALDACSMSSGGATRVSDGNTAPITGCCAASAVKGDGFFDNIALRLASKTWPILSWRDAKGILEDAAATKEIDNEGVRRLLASTFSSIQDMEKLSYNIFP